MRRRVILAAFVAGLVLVSLIAFLLVGSENAGPSVPQPPLPHIIPGAQNVTGAVAGSEAINIALANDEVKQWVDKGHQLYGVFQSDSVYWVAIITNEQQLPWVVGISIIVPVQFNSSDPIVVNFELTLANLTQSEKEQTLRVASDTIKAYGGSAKADDVRVSHWEDSLGGRTAFHAYPCISFRVPEDQHKPGSNVSVYVDLQKGEVARVISYPSKPLP